MPRTLKPHISKGLDAEEAEDKSLGIQIRNIGIDAECKAMVQAVSGFAEDGFMIGQATKKDVPNIAKLAVQMWDSAALSELETEIAETIGCENAVFFIYGERRNRGMG